MADRVEMTVPDTVLAILHGRLWGMTYDQIAADPAWEFIHDSQRGERDYDFGVPTTRTLDLAVLNLVETEAIERRGTGTPYYRLRRRSFQNAQRLAKQIAALTD